MKAGSACEYSVWLFSLHTLVYSCFENVIFIWWSTWRIRRTYNINCPSH